MPTLLSLKSNKYFPNSLTSEVYKLTKANQSYFIFLFKVYPIMNPIPLNYGYEFFYSKESPAFMITPLKGTIEANSTENI